jgi:hypothetical protein
MGTRRRRQQQEGLWIGHDEVAKGPGHPFYKKVNELLEEAKFDDSAEKECAKFYAENNGRPSLRTIASCTTVRGIVVGCSGRYRKTSRYLAFSASSQPFSSLLRDEASLF